MTILLCPICQGYGLQPPMEVNGEIVSLRCRKCVGQGSVREQEVTARDLLLAVTESLHAGNFELAEEWSEELRRLFPGPAERAGALTQEVAERIKRGEPLF